MKTHFGYGEQGIEVELPPGFEALVLNGRSAPALANALAGIEQALDHPIGSAPLAVLARGKHTAAISVCDITRPAPNQLTLPPLLQRLHQAGIPPECVTILIATGLHREATADEVVRIVGPEVAARYRIVSHNARDLAAHRSLGETSRGTPVLIDERFMAADLHITLGFVEQHLMLGFSGGRKLVAPGVAGEQTIKRIHSPRFMREPLAHEGSIEANPLHAELLEVAAMARHDFMLDVTLTRERKISGVFAGSPVEAHGRAVEFLRSTSMERFEGLADAVITSAAGHPLDLTFYQVLKGITAAQHVVKPGAPILVVGECAEGIGSPEFAAMLKAYPGHAAFLEAIRTAPVEVDQWQLEKLALCGLAHPLLFFTPRIPPAEMGFLGALAFEELETAVHAMLQALTPGAKVALIPEGPYTFAREGTALHV